MILKRGLTPFFFVDFDIVFKFLNFFKNKRRILNINLFIFNIFILFRFFFFFKINFQFFNIFKNFSLIIYNFSIKYNFLKNKNFYFLYKLFLFKHIKYIYIYYFFFYQKNIKSLFFLQFYSNFTNFCINLKNNFYLNLKNLNLHKLNKSGWYSTNLNFLKNYNKIIFNFSFLSENLSNSFKLINRLLDCNFFFSFFFLWKFLLYIPFSNFFFNLFNNDLSFLNIFKIKTMLNNLKNFNLSIYKYFNIVDYNHKYFSENVVFHFMQLKRKIYKFIEDAHFSDILVRFLGSISKMKSFVFINKSLKQQLTSHEWLKFDLLRRRFMVSIRFKSLRLNTSFLQQPIYKAYGKKYDINFYWFEITLVCFLTYKLRDTTILLTYLYNKMKVMSLFNHRSFLRRICFILRTLFYEIGSWYSIKGIKIRVSGKISVTGNARTRTIHFKEGLVSNSNMNIRVDHNFSIIKTNTGCLGLSLWLFY